MLENITIKVLSGQSLPYPVEEIIQLTGLTGIHPVFEKRDNINIQIFPYGDCVKIDITSTVLNFLQIFIYPIPNFIDNKYIRKNAVNVPNVAGKWVNAQTRQALHKGFSFLQAEAFKDDTGTTDVFCGYIVWAKMGYEIWDKSIAEYDNLLRKNNIPHTSLFNLISTKDGLAFWTENGFSWDAKFDLHENSESFRMLNEYKQRKGIA